MKHRGKRHSENHVKPYQLKTVPKNEELDQKAAIMLDIHNKVQNIEAPTYLMNEPCRVKTIMSLPVQLNAQSNAISTMSGRDGNIENLKPCDLVILSSNAVNNELLCVIGQIKDIMFQVYSNFVDNCDICHLNNLGYNEVRSNILSYLNRHLVQDSDTISGTIQSILQGVVSMPANNMYSIINMSEQAMSRTVYYMNTISDQIIVYTSYYMCQNINNYLNEEISYLESKRFNDLVSEIKEKFLLNEGCEVQIGTYGGVKSFLGEASRCEIERILRTQYSAVIKHIIDNLCIHAFYIYSDMLDEKFTFNNECKCNNRVPDFHSKDFEFDDDDED